MTLVTKEVMQEALTHVSNDSSGDFFAMEAANFNADVEYASDKMMNESAGADTSTSPSDQVPILDENGSKSETPDVVPIAVKNETDLGAADNVTGNSGMGKSVKEQKITSDSGKVTPAKPSSVSNNAPEDPKKIEKDLKIKTEYADASVNGYSNAKYSKY